MSNPSNALTSTVAPSEPAASSSASRVPTTGKMIAYSYAERLVYVAMAETYDGAIEIAKESIREIRDVKREHIRFKFDITLILSKTDPAKTGMAEVAPTAWPTVMALLPALNIVEVHVAPVFPHGQAASAIEPPPYAPEKSGHADSQTNVALNGPQTPNTQSPSPPSLVTRIMGHLTPKCSRRHPTS